VIRASLIAFVVAFVTAFIVIPMTGCKNPNRPGRYKAPASTSSISTQPAPKRVTTPAKTPSASRRAGAAVGSAAVSTGLGSSERVQLIDEETAKDLRLQSSWQQQIPYRGSGGIKQVMVAGGDVVVVDQVNSMTVFDASSGKELWHEAPIPPREKIFGIDRFYMDEEDLLLVTTDTDLYIVGADTGLTVTRQNLAQIPTTPVLKSGDDLIFGTARGRIVWHNIAVGYELKANGLGSGIVGVPVQMDSRSAAVSTKGKVGLFDSKSARRIWTRQLNAGFEFGPLMTERALYASDTGQRINCFDINTGETLWTYFSEYPVSSAPKIFDDRIIQEVGIGGTICLEAMPATGSRSGNRLWQNPDLQGDVVTVLGDDLIMWSAADHVLNRVDSNDGSIKKSTTLKMVDQVQVATNEETGKRMLLVFNTDGRVQKLDPRK
jgi:outer membrane protein assembly factor BamB